MKIFNDLRLMTPFYGFMITEIFEFDTLMNNKLAVKAIFLGIELLMIWAFLNTIGVLGIELSDFRT